jgi:hypothetical protein
MIHHEREGWVSGHDPSREGERDGLVATTKGLSRSLDFEKSNGG